MHRVLQPPSGIKIELIQWKIKFLLKGERILGAVRTQALNSKELTKMVTNMDRKCYQTSAGVKVKDLTN